MVLDLTPTIFCQLKKTTKTSVLAAISERMLPEYTNFVRRELFGSVPHYRSTVDQVWEHIAGQQIFIHIPGHGMTDEMVYELYDDFFPYVDDTDAERIGVADTGCSYDGREATIAIISAIMSCARVPSPKWRPNSIHHPIADRLHEYLPHGVLADILETQEWNPETVMSIRERCRAETTPIDWKKWESQREERWKLASENPPVSGCTDS